MKAEGSFLLSAMFIVTLSWLVSIVSYYEMETFKKEIKEQNESLTIEIENLKAENEKMNRILKTDLILYQRGWE